MSTLLSLSGILDCSETKGNNQQLVYSRQVVKWIINMATLIWNCSKVLPTIASATARANYVRSSGATRACAAPCQWALHWQPWLASKCPRTGSYPCNRHQLAYNICVSRVDATTLAPVPRYHLASIHQQWLPLKSRKCPQ